MLPLPVASVNLAAATEIEPVPDCVLVVGVNTTEYTVEDVVVSALMVPPEKVMSAAVKVLDASESVKVMVSVWPDRSVVDPARVMVTVGSRVSKGIDKVFDAVLSLPAESVNLAAATERVPVPDSVSAVGVNKTRYTVEETVVSEPMLPPVTVMSLTAKVLDASDSVKVMVLFCLTPIGNEYERETVTVGARVS
jgi:Flp pilus assembly pilin Flp